MTSDPYFDIRRCIDKLLDSYKKYGNLIVAFDFDDTVFDWHKEGHQYNAVINLLKKCKSLDFVMILFTCREGELLQDAVSHCESLGIKPDYINQCSRKDRNGRKPFYNILLDDKAGLNSAFTILNEAVEQIIQMRSST